MYASLDLDVAFAERLKRTGFQRTPLLVGIARASIARTLDLTSDQTLATFGLSVTAVTGPDYAPSQRLGRELFETGVAALLVPAAIAEVPTQLPRFVLVRERERQERTTPGVGVNLVIFTGNLRPGDGYREIERFLCAIFGLSPGDER